MPRRVTSEASPESKATVMKQLAALMVECKKYKCTICELTAALDVEV